MEGKEGGGKDDGFPWRRFDRERDMCAMVPGERARIGDKPPMTRILKTVCRMQDCDIDSFLACYNDSNADKTWKDERMNGNDFDMSREDEYREKCRRVKTYYSEEICEHESAGCYGDAESTRKQRQRELEALDHQYRDGEPMMGCGIALQ